MKWDNLVSVLCRLALAAVLAAGIASLAISQFVPESGRILQDSSRQAQMAKLRQAQDDTTMAKAGWLILNGQLIPGPYNSSVVGSLVIINGITVFGEKKTTGQDTMVIDEGNVTWLTVTREFRTRMKQWHEKGDIKAVRRKSYEFMTAQPIVDSVKYASEILLAVWFAGQKWPEHYYLGLPLKRSTSQTDFSQERARTYHDRLMVQLNSGALVLMENEHYTTIHYPKSESVFQELRNIARDIPNLTDRTAKIESLIGKKWPARKIAEDSARAAYMAKLRYGQNDTTAERTGWLILNGEYIPGPYQVTAEKTQIYINGHKVMGSDLKPMDYWTSLPDSVALDLFIQDTTIRPEIRDYAKVKKQDKEWMGAVQAKGEFYDSLFAKYKYWVEEVGLDEARDFAFEFMSSHPDLDTAYRYPESRMGFAIRFKGDNDDREIILNRPKTSRLSSEDRLAERYKQLAARLQGHLSDRSLVVFQGGKYTAIPSPRGYPAFGNIQKIISSKPDVQERIIAIKKIVGLPGAADAIANKFQAPDE